MNAHMKGYRGGEPVADAAGWRFELGEFVTHKDQSLPSRVRGGLGRPRMRDLRRALIRHLGSL